MDWNGMCCMRAIVIHRPNAQHIHFVNTSGQNFRILNECAFWDGANSIFFLSSRMVVYIFM